MSVQSESGRIDYAKSDHAPKGTKMAGDSKDLLPAPPQFGVDPIPYEANKMMKEERKKRDVLDSPKYWQPG